MQVQKHSGPDKALSLDDLVEKLGASKRSLYRMAHAGKLPGVFKLGNRWKMRPEALEELLAQQEAQHRGLMPSASAPPPKSAPDYSKLEQQLADMSIALLDIQRAMHLLTEPVRKLVVPAHRYGIEAIYAPRRSLEGPSANQAIAALLDQTTAGEILLQGITLRQFFHDTAGGQRSILRSKLQEGRVRIRALFLDPLSQAARARMTAEESTGGGKEYRGAAPALLKTQTFADILMTITQIKKLQEELPLEARDDKSESLLEARCYERDPSALCIITEEGLINEQYHWGRNPDNKYAKAEICIGEHVPLIHVRANTSYYNHLRDSFNYLWQGSDPEHNCFINVKSLDQVCLDIEKLRQDVSEGSKQTLG